MIWQRARLGDVCRILPGYAFKSQDWQDFGVPVIRIKNIQSDRSISTTDIACIPDSLVTPRLEKFLLKDGDILIAMTGATAGKAGRLRTIQRMLLNQRVAKIAPFAVNERFIWSVVSSDEYRARFFHLADGAAQPNMSGPQIENVEIPLPPRIIQRKIASILSAYDDLIENNLRRIKILEEMAQALYREWFVKFRFPGHEKVRMVDSSLGKIPEGWAVGRLDDALILQRGFDLPKKNRYPGDVRIYAATGPHGFHKEAKVKGPGVVTGRSGSLGSVMYVEQDFWPLNTTLWVKEFKESSPLFAYYLLKEMKLEQYNSGAAVPTLNRNDVHGLAVARPPTSILELFDEHILPAMSLREKLRRKSDNLRTTRDILLPKLISGDLDVSDLDIIIPEEAA